MLEILDWSADDIRRQHDVEFIVTGVAELGGGAVSPQGLDIKDVLRNLRARQPVAGLDSVGRSGLSPIAMINAARPDTLLEATPVNLMDGEPGLSAVLHALATGAHAVLANKGPLALAYQQLSTFGDVYDGVRRNGSASRPRLRFSGCVGGALPVINVGLRDLAGSRILRLEGVLNGTSRSILRGIERGDTYDEALRSAQARGITESNPAYDVDGLDAACKLVIAANAVLGQATRISDVKIRGMRELDPQQVRTAPIRGGRIAPQVLAEIVGGRYQLSVEPNELPLDHPLSRLHPDEMGIVYTTDTIDRLFAASLKPGPLPASAAMIRDVLDIVNIEPSPPHLLPSFT